MENNLEHHLLIMKGALASIKYSKEATEPFV